jgi:membrane protein implicated in regulation of membrane protease activity
VIANLRLFAHAITLGVWALFAALLDLQGTTTVIVLMCATVAVASVVAERERSRRRRGQAER